MAKKDYHEYKCDNCGHVLRDYGGGQEWCPFCGKRYYPTQEEMLDAGKALGTGCVGAIMLLVIIIIVIIALYYIITGYFL